MILKNFIVLEGIDGAGTSTQLNLLKNRLSPEKTVYTAEPTTLSTGRFLRSVLRGDEKLTPETTAFLFAADRQEHVYGTGGIVESCTSGKLVISDRYVFSSLAYQSITCGEELPHGAPYVHLVIYDKDSHLSSNRKKDTQVGGKRP